MGWIQKNITAHNRYKKSFGCCVREITRQPNFMSKHAGEMQCLHTAEKVKGSCATPHFSSPKLKI